MTMIVIGIDIFNIDKREFFVRSDGRLEWTCEHGVGHTVGIPEKTENGVDIDPEHYAWWSHGCEGCCSTLNWLPVSEHVPRALSEIFVSQGAALRSPQK